MSTTVLIASTMGEGRSWLAGAVEGGEVEARGDLSLVFGDAGMQEVGQVGHRPIVPTAQN